jgi:hypothetical protein
MRCRTGVPDIARLRRALTRWWRKQAVCQKFRPPCVSKEDSEHHHGSAKAGLPDDAGPAVTDAFDGADDEQSEWSAARCV